MLKIKENSNKEILDEDKSHLISESQHPKEKIINLMLEFDNSTETVSGINNKINSIDLSNFLITILFVSVIFSFTIIFLNFIIIKK